MDGHAGEIRNEAAGVPGLAVAFRFNVLDPWRWVLDHPLPDARQVARGDAHTAGAARRAEAIDRDVRAALGADRLPQDLAHQVGVAPAGGALDHPAEEITIGGDVMEPPAV